jgi:3',5'-cyclic AMP phosphodiesterase CpdA
MTLVAHLSDLHFGRADPVVVAALVADLRHRRPDLIVVSGDLTQRARAGQFAQARHFLDQLPAPVLAVPGNHDLAPLHRPISRLFRPRARFRRHLPAQDPWPVWHDHGVVAIGLDSTRPLRWISGKLRQSHLDHIEQVMETVPAGACVLAFLHHPPATAPDGHPFAALADRGIDIVLAGHVHKSRIGLIAGEGTRACLLVQASTACSTRLRGDANGYGLIDIAMPQIGVTLLGWSGEAFRPGHRASFEKARGRWHAVSEKSLFINSL